MKNILSYRVKDSVCQTLQQWMAEWDSLQENSSHKYPRSVVDTALDTPQPNLRRSEFQMWSEER